MKVTCKNCGKEFNKNPAEIKKSKTGNVYCSRSCSNSMNNRLFKTGKLSPNYKNGNSSYRQIMLRTCENECKDCGNQDVRVLEVHHIDGNRKNNEIDNLVILCANCHKIRHFENDL